MQWLEGRRQKKGSAMELLMCFRFVLKRSKRCLLHPFNYCKSTVIFLIYPQGWDLFFFIFIILSLFYGFYVIDFK
ncbi:TPA: hypothetical protein ACJI8Q_003607, partial [Morganella morganii]